MNNKKNYVSNSLMLCMTYFGVCVASLMLYECEGILRNIGQTFKNKIMRYSLCLSINSNLTDYTSLILRIQAISFFGTELSFQE